MIPPRLPDLRLCKRLETQSQNLCQFKMPAIAKPFITHAKDSPAYWQIGNLWKAMATGVQTDNSFTLLDQVVHTGGGGGRVTHTHTQDEGLYVVRGNVPSTPAATRAWQARQELS
jgi:hypothetical protein